MGASEILVRYTFDLREELYNSRSCRHASVLRTRSWTLCGEQTRRVASFNDVPKSSNQYDTKGNVIEARLDKNSVRNGLEHSRENIQSC